MNYTIRNERPDDYAAVLSLTYEAFQTLDFPGRCRMDEHYLIHLLRGMDYVIPGLSFVAELEGKNVGHILYTRSAVGGKPTVTFGPLSVLPEYQRQGIGRALVEHSMEKAREMGFGAVLITGVPDYYPKLGFLRGRDLGVTLPDGTSPDFLMGFELIPGYLSCGGVLSFEANDIFEQSENDDTGFAAFHGNFMREYKPGQLTLRTFWETDIALMACWLYAPHVSKWYHYPEEWLESLKNRRGEFAFVTPLIAEYEGRPIGFCRYYDCHSARRMNYPHWNEELPNPNAPGEVFSMDIFVGEADCLGHGFGRQMTVLMVERLQKLGAKTIIVEPEKENAASCRVLETCGFKLCGKEYVLELEK